MSWFKSIPYISMPFTYIYGIIRENDTTKNKIFFAVLGLFFLTAGVYVLFKWHDIPKYTHDVYIKRVYSNDSLRENYVWVCYNLFLFNGGIITPNRENGSTKLESFVFRNDCHMKGQGIRQYPSGIITDILNEDRIQQIDSFSNISSLPLDVYENGFLLSHKYIDDHPKLRNNINVGVVDTLYYDSFKEKTLWIEREKNNDEDSTLFVKYNSYSSAWHGSSHPKNFYTVAYYQEEGLDGFDRVIEDNCSDFCKKFQLFFMMHDISKSKYNFYFTSDDIDSTIYRIYFNEDVSFSRTSIDADYIDNHSITFTSSSLEKFSNKFRLSGGIELTVLFNDSSNLQTLRVLILSALLALPFGLFVKNIWAILLLGKNAKAKTKKKRKKRKKI